MFARTPWSVDYSVDCTDAILDWRQPSATGNGVLPGNLGWVYVKEDIYSGECKVGCTYSELWKRRVETGNRHLVLRTAFWIQASHHGHLAREAERFCHMRLGRDRMGPHLMSSGQSEFFSGPGVHVANQVERCIQDFLNVFWPGVSAAAVRFDPTYDIHAVRARSNLRAPFWEQWFNLKGLHEAHDILYPHTR